MIKQIPVHSMDKDVRAAANVEEELTQLASAPISDTFANTGTDARVKKFDVVRYCYEH